MGCVNHSGQPLRLIRSLGQAAFATSRWSVESALALVDSLTCPTDWLPAARCTLAFFGAGISDR